MNFTSIAGKPLSFNGKDGQKYVAIPPSIKGGTVKLTAADGSVQNLQMKDFQKFMLDNLPVINKEPAKDVVEFRSKAASQPIVEKAETIVKEVEKNADSIVNEKTVINEAENIVETTVKNGKFGKVGKIAAAIALAVVGFAAGLKAIKPKAEVEEPSDTAAIPDGKVYKTQNPNVEGQTLEITQKEDDKYLVAGKTEGKTRDDFRVMATKDEIKAYLSEGKPFDVMKHLLY